MKTYSPLPKGWRIAGDYLITPDVSYGCHKDCERFIHGDTLAGRCDFVARTLEGYGFAEYAAGWTELGRLRAALRSLSFEVSHLLHGGGDNAQACANELRNALALLGE